MTKTYDWMLDKSRSTNYFYDVSDGRVIGQVTNIVHTGIWVAKIVFNHNEEKFLGQYISEDFGKAAIQMYWDIQNRTLLQEH